MPSPTQQEAITPQHITPPLDDLPITPLWPSAPPPSCACTSEWEHEFFNCEALYRMPKDGYLREEQREKAWTAILRGQTFCLGSLKKAKETTPIYQALRQEKAVLLRFLPLWHEEIRRDWNGLFEDQKCEQEDVIFSGMEVFNRIVGLLLRRENESCIYAGEKEMDEEMRRKVGVLVFDLGDVDVREDGVQGRPALGYHDLEGCICEDEGTEEAQIGEEKDRHDSGVAMEADQERALEEVQDGEEKNRHDSGVAMEAGQEIALEEVQNAGKHGNGKKESSSDDEEGGVPLELKTEEVYVADDKIEQVDVGDEQIGKQKEEDDVEAKIDKRKEEVNPSEEKIGKQKEEAQVDDSKIGNESEEEYAVDEGKEAPWRKLVSDRDFGQLFERRYHVGDWDDSE